MTPTDPSHADLAALAKTLLEEARRAHERGDAAERDQLLDRADEQLRLLVAATPPYRRPIA
jgi:hypothetical protein